MFTEIGKFLYSRYCHHDPTVTRAVTVDWVVLTAALVGLGLAVMAVVSGGVEEPGNNPQLEEIAD